MKGLLLTLLGLWPGGDREQGLQLYREGRFAEAAAAFQRAVQSEGDSPELQWNLALAHWRAGELAAAETAAEKYAATSASVQVDLHSGLLGAIRHQEALAKVAEADAAQAAAGQPPTTAAGTAPAAADPLPLLQAALAKANQARDHFVRGAKVEATPELRRNTERTLRLIDELKRRIEALEQQRQPSEDQDQKDSKKEDQPDQSKQDEQSQQDQKESEPKDPQQQDQQAGKPEQQEGKPDQSQPGQDGKPSADGEPKPEPQPGGKTGEQEPAEPKPEPGQPSQDEDQKPADPSQDTTPRQDAPGEQQEARELSPEQTQRLLERLQGLDGKQKAIRARAKSSRRTVERDW